MGKKQKPKHKNDFSNMKCPYCGAKVIYRSSEGIYKEAKSEQMLYVCSNYPECNAYVRCHAGTNIPVGELANGELRKKRREAHQSFDALYANGQITRDDAYAWLADLLNKSRKEAHIGSLNEYYCNLVILKSKELLAFREKNKI